MLVTSPPYYGLRDYGVDGQIGLEATPEQYVDALVEVFDQVRRVLTTDGTLWVVIGDSYSSVAYGPGEGGGIQGATWRGEGSKHDQGHGRVGPKVQPNRMPLPGLKAKDLIGVPWMVAFALRASGWYLREDVIWHKPNALPESVKDRPTRAHEYVFLLAKSKRYFYDWEAVAEVASYGNHRRTSVGTLPATPPDADSHSPSLREFREPGGFRNRRSVWSIPSAPFGGAHFATFPPALAELCVRAGSEPGDTVLDPFAGAGTTGLVAGRLGRDFVGVELNLAYARLAKRRIEQDAPLLNRVGMKTGSAS